MWYEQTCCKRYQNDSMLNIAHYSTKRKKKEKKILPEEDEFSYE